MPLARHSSVSCPSCVADKAEACTSVKRGVGYAVVGGGGMHKVPASLDERGPADVAQAERLVSQTTWQP